MPKRNSNGTAKAKKTASASRTLEARAKSNGHGAAKKPGKRAAAARRAPARAAPSRGASARRAPATPKKGAPVPPQYGTATPHLVVSPCSEALEFYQKAFGAKVLLTMPGPEGRILHAEMKIGDSIVMCSDEMPVPGGPSRKTPKNAGATTGGVMLYVKDVDAFFEKAVAAGAASVMPPTDQFWGDRYGQLEDPFGHVWAVATHLYDLTPKQMQKEMQKMFAQQEAASA